MQHVPQLLADVFRLLAAEGIAHCVMEDSGSRLDRSDRQTEIVVPQKSLAEIPALLREHCRRHGARLVQYREYGCNAYHCVIAHQNARGRYGFLAFRVCGDYWRYGRELLTADEILRQGCTAD